MKRVLAAMAALFVLLLAGCGSSTPTKTAADIGASTTTTTGLPTTSAATGTVTTTVTATTRPPGTTTTARAPQVTPTTATTEPPARSGTVPLNDSDDGTTVRVKVGSTIVVVLNTTFWGFPAPPSPAVLRQVGGVTMVTVPLHSCVPGGGCGTTSATYQAVGLGQAQITASRTSCGEALLCTGKAGSYAVQVVVTAS